MAGGRILYVVEKVYRYLGWTVVAVAVAVAALRIFALRWWQVPPSDRDAELSASIAPSMAGGDWVLLWRLTRPGLGDLVVCPDPDDPSLVVIGRIAAEAGDRVVIEGQGVRINEQKPHIEYNCTEHAFSLSDPDTEKTVELFCDMEQLGERLHQRAHRASLDKSGRRFEKKVENGKVFLLSDNRVHPFDSRHFGTLERASCTETVFFRLVSEKGFFDQERRLTYIR